MPARLEGKVNRAVGAKQTTRAIAEGRAVVVYLAKDAEERVTSPIASLCTEKGLEVIFVDSMRDLGAKCGIDVGAAAAALLE
ncbi:MAG: ribosomal L7Ae/L30e/S12e/Gadd45 family protein [Limnochordia bacterium]|jgi:large subunit ribosomal protein L7A